MAAIGRRYPHPRLTMRESPARGRVQTSTSIQARPRHARPRAALTPLRQPPLPRPIRPPPDGPSSRRGSSITPRVPTGRDPPVQFTRRRNHARRPVTGPRDLGTKFAPLGSGRP
jgi:hypothetical protein